jgi:predicted HTH transcriptional regulator
MAKMLSLKEEFLETAAQIAELRQHRAAIEHELSKALARFDSLWHRVTPKRGSAANEPEIEQVRVATKRGKQPDPNSLQQRVLRFIADHSGAVTLDRMAAELKAEEKRIRWSLSYLVSRGLVKKAGRKQWEFNASGNGRARRPESQSIAA